MYRLVVFDHDGTLADLSGWPYSLADMYPDMRRAVGNLRSDGFILALATLMSTGSAERILHKWGVRDLFDCVKGRSGTYKKGPLIRACIEETENIPSETLMVGDSPGDLDGARMCGTDFVGAPRSGFDATDGVYVPADGDALVRFVKWKKRCTQVK